MQNMLLRALLATFAAATLQGASAETGKLDLRRSGADFMGASTQAMQRDDSLNPGMLWVKDGEALWQRAPGNGAPSCAGCHGTASASMRGVAARYPAFDTTLQRPVDLSERINVCRQTHQQSTPFKPESAELLGLQSYVAFQSRGMPIAPPSDPRLQAFVERGRQRFNQRMGQLDLSCAQCHDSNAGGRLGSSQIPQAHPAGYPVYRLEWQGVGSLQRRLRNCMSGVRAESFLFGAIELVELELYLNARARGMPVEAPGVRP
ncbi:MAG: sulfur oxidation c-type cytochrome SoxA [Herminiimonas sp.]|nr:sulfur oxidation c-type cytochrome SoxA [Herminiimonas sp.]